MVYMWVKSSRAEMEEGKYFKPQNGSFAVEI
jgi:hypothetical protein